MVDSSDQAGGGLGVFLRPIFETDIPWMFSVETDPNIIWRFRLGGMTPQFDQYKRLVFSNILDQAIVVDSKDGMKVGFVYADKYDPINGIAEVSVVSSRESIGSGLALHGMLLFIDRLFKQFHLRKLIGESLEFNVHKFANKDGLEDFSTLVKFESRYPDYYYLSGRYWDRYQVAIFREDWEDQYERILASARRRLMRLASGEKVPGVTVDATDPTIYLDSQHFRLRAVQPADDPWCSNLVQSAASSGSLRYPDFRLSPRYIQRQLWEGVVCQFIARDRFNNISLALVTLFNIGSANLIGWLHALIEPEFVGLPVSYEPLLLFVSYVFSCWPLRKLCLCYVADAPELKAWKDAFKVDGSTLWRRVSSQQEQANYMGRFVNLETWILDRDEWSAKVLPYRQGAYRS